MNSVVTPTITASDPHEYRAQMELVVNFAERVHVDFADGEFAPTKLLSPDQAWVPSGKIVDLHVMYQNPAAEIETLIALKPNLIILHAESLGNILGQLREIKSAGIKAGVALLQNSQPEEFSNEIEEADHVLIFGGHLGYHGGQADLSMLDKIERVKAINKFVEMGWDGGANAENSSALATAGVEVINVGGYIHKADDPKAAYAIIKSIVSK